MTFIVACGDSTPNAVTPPGDEGQPRDTVRDTVRDTTSAPVAITPGMAVAIVDNSPAVHVFFVGRLDGAVRSQLHFVNVVDSIAGNFPFNPVRDDKLRVLASPALSPDGAKLATVVTVAPIQSEIVVMDTNGTHAQVASANFQIIVGTPAWSPDGSKLAYAMSTQLDTAGIDLFVTDLATHAVTRLTTNADARATAIRWSPDGKAILYSRRTGLAPDGAGNAISEIVKVDVAARTSTTIASGILGDVCSIAPSATRYLVTHVIAPPNVAVQLLDRSFAGAERVVLDSNAVTGHYVSRRDDVGVVVRKARAGTNTVNETLVMDLGTRTGLPVVGAGSSTVIDAFHR